MFRVPTAHAQKREIHDIHTYMHTTVVLLEH